MSKATRDFRTNVEVFEPLLELLYPYLIRPNELAAHWGYTEEYLHAMRKAGRGPAFLKLPTGGVRYRASDIIRAELAGTRGPLTVDRVCETLAACERLTLEARVVAQHHIQHTLRGRLQV